MEAGHFFIIFFCLSTLALDNGFTVPAKGWSSWYAAPDGSQVTDAFIRASAQALITSGLASKGYVYVNCDEGWLQGRHASNNSIYEDLTKFPFGMTALGSYINSLPVAPGHSETMKFGLYSCRGTCQCSTDKYNGPGSHGFEALDTQWMVDAGAKWLKIDSCCGSQDHATAFADYAKFRDAMNISGTHVWFNLCGWSPWYAPPDSSINYTGGFSLGNSFRIWGDGGSWQAITGAINTMAAVGNWTRVGGYPDPDNILGPHGTVGTVTESQARVQMILWSLAPTQLILGEDVTQMSQEFIDTVGNEELLAINADTPFIGASRRIVGEDLTFPCSSSGGAVLQVQTQNCSTVSQDSTQLFYFNNTDSSLRPYMNPTSLLSTQTCDFNDGDIVSAFYMNGGASSCGGAVWKHMPNGSIVGANGKCLDEYMWTTPRVDLWTCVPGAMNENWTFTKTDNVPPIDGFSVGTVVNADSGFCLTVSPPAPINSCTNIWARPLSNGDVALAFINNGDLNATVTCDQGCFNETGLLNAKEIKVRDLIKHVDLPNLVPPFSMTVLLGKEGAGLAYRLQPEY